ncbi:MAG: DUF29 domain-containing protein, partial [Microcystis sp.]
MKDRANSLYESDFYGWTELQAKVLANRQVEELDWQNLREEIISLGKQEYRELVSRLTVLVGHLLKWEYQPDKRSKSWRVTIRGQRREINFLLDKNPSLKSYLDEAILLGYAKGLDLVVEETPLDDQDLPEVCPYKLE